MSKYRHYLISATLILSIFTTSCAALSDFFDGIGSAFRGNTKRDPHNYTIEDKRTYRKFRYQKKMERNLEEEEILRRLENDEKNGVLKKTH